ncbi:KEOPS complex subunit Pcc1 [[Eubacterium] cellulosolvens]
MRTHEAKLVIHLGNQRLATSILKSLEADNKQEPTKTRIKGYHKGGDLCITISTSENPATLLATLDDLLVCIQAAEKSLRTL